MDYLREKIEQPWSTSPLRQTFISKHSILIVFMIICCSLLTAFARTGELIFNNQPISWKLILYNVVLEAMYFIVISDILSVAVDYFLTNGGITLQQLGHAIGNATSLHPTVEKFSYSICFYLTTGLLALVPPVLLSLVLLDTSNGSSRVRAPDQDVLTNALGGRFGDNFGMTGHLFLFTSVREKYIFNPDRQQYVVYQNSTTTGSRSVFVPKTPQIGTYAEDVNSNVGVDIVQARVQNVQGLLYKCNPTVREEPKNIGNFTSVNNNLRGELFKLLGLNMTAVEGSNRAKATFFLKVAIKKQEQSTAVLTIPCTVTAAEGNLDINKEDDGFMTMAVNGEFKELSLPLPPRVLGEKESLLDIAMENSISALGINIVRHYIANTDNLQQWDGLIRCLVGAFGIRSALHNTFADFDDQRAAVDVFKSGISKSGVEQLRVLFIWIPIILVCVSRILTYAKPTVLSEGLWQVSAWLPKQLTEDLNPNTKFYLGLNDLCRPEFRANADNRVLWSSLRSIRNYVESPEKDEGH